VSGAHALAAESPRSDNAGDRRRPGLNEPWRGLVALGELVLAAAAVLVGVLCWHRGIVRIDTPVGGGQPPLVSTVFYGNWMGGAVGLVTVGAFLVLDAVRETLLALRTRQRPAPEALLYDTDEDPIDSATDTGERHPADPDPADAHQPEPDTRATPEPGGAERSESESGPESS
jgi:hypothetical protein